MGCAGASCGGAGDTEVLTYVGTGGSYSQETSYKYVGQGAGEFDMVSVGGTNWCCIGGVACGALTLLALILVIVLGGGTATSTTTMIIVPSPKPTPKPAPPTTTPVPTPAPAVTTPLSTLPPVTMPVETTPNPCNVGGIDTWSAEKRTYCCTHYHNGCPTTAPPATLPATLPPSTPPPPQYDCNAGFANWQSGWSIAKKAWCCAHEQKGCPPAGGCETSKAPYDCDAGLANFVSGWSVAKKAWCCTHEHKGCPPAGGCETTAVPM